METVFVYAGRLATEKNLKMLLAAFLQLPATPPCRLLLIGDGPLRPELEHLADARVLFAGYRRGEELARYYAAADVFVFPSLTETFGNVILEGMASGLPTVAFRVPGPQDIIADGETGLLVGEISAAALAAAMRELTAGPGREEMAVRARRHAEGQSWPAILSGLRHGYEEALLVKN